jgi:hypothetical protein
MQNALRNPAKTGSGTGPTGPAGAPPGADPTGNKPRTTQNVPPRSIYRKAIDNLGTTQADSLPIPLLVLAGLGTLLLLTAGGLAGAKRYRAVRGRPKPPPKP